MDYAAILTKNYPGRQFSVGDTYESIKALDGGDIPSRAELDAAWPDVEAAIEARAQARRDAKASAIAKLGALGLTVDEVSVAFGLEATSE